MRKLDYWVEEIIDVEEYNFLVFRLGGLFMFLNFVGNEWFARCLLNVVWYMVMI